MHFTAEAKAIATTCSNCEYLLTDPKVISDRIVGYRYTVELVSREWFLQDDRPVPKQEITLDVVVATPSEADVKQLVAATNWLSDYAIADYWQHDSNSYDYCPF